MGVRLRFEAIGPIKVSKSERHFASTNPFWYDAIRFRNRDDCQDLLY
jgi:hypothetical protein